ncbi:threonine synthase [Anaerosporomusa subterranea]|uniref:Threonine synthase n=1 Tax=Anaerosporomusa subterranea TaxID=1794912 RepID=A0A154BVD8_ANASB|nr:threonine synthase [Anaerosporomusa subterranea]KYZ77994.1 threonine synthase [Anaerosporomusa subterranea]
MKNLPLVCTKCGKSFRMENLQYRCDLCNEPLEVELLTCGKISDGNLLTQTMLERYAEFLPFASLDRDISLGEGFTPLIQSESLAEKLGIGELYLKNEAQNPTWSFKDRGTVAGVQHARKLGYKRIGTVSTGNMASSVAAYARKAGMEAFIFVSKNIAAEKINPIAIYNPHLIRVDGDYGNLYYESLKIGQTNQIYFINSDATFRIEGSKTIAFEICEQLHFDMPDYVIIPTSAGGNLRGIEKGFREFHACGLIENVPKIICAQASGCSPICNAFHAKQEEVSRVLDPHTIAHGIENPFPPSGNQTLRLLKRTGGFAVAVPDDATIKAQAMLAEIGLFVQPESAVPIAAIQKLRSENYLTGKEKIVSIITGSGLKFTEALTHHTLTSVECKLEDISRYIRDNFDQ